MKIDDDKWLEIVRAYQKLDQHDNVHDYYLKLKKQYSDYEKIITDFDNPRQKGLKSQIKKMDFNIDKFDIWIELLIAQLEKTHKTARAIQELFKNN
jgi:hypothetical protein